jgi:hypothetical protein
LNEKFKRADQDDVQLRAAVGTASHQLGSEACTVYGMSRNMLRNHRAEPKISAQN